MPSVLVAVSTYRTPASTPLLTFICPLVAASAPPRPAAAVAFVTASCPGAAPAAAAAAPAAEAAAADEAALLASACHWRSMSLISSSCRWAAMQPASSLHSTTGRGYTPGQHLHTHCLVMRAGWLIHQVHQAQQHLFPVHMRQSPERRCNEMCVHEDVHHLPFAPTLPVQHALCTTCSCLTFHHSYAIDWQLAA
jgi:hypothetical protein